MINWFFSHFWFSSRDANCLVLEFCSTACSFPPNWCSLLKLYLAPIDLSFGSKEKLGPWVDRGANQAFFLWWFSSAWWSKQFFIRIFSCTAHVKIYNKFSSSGTKAKHLRLLYRYFTHDEMACWTQNANSVRGTPQMWSSYQTWGLQRRFCRWNDRDCNECQQSASVVREGRRGDPHPRPPCYQSRPQTSWTILVSTARSPSLQLVHPTVHGVRQLPPNTLHGLLSNQMKGVHLTKIGHVNFIWFLESEEGSAFDFGGFIKGLTSVPSWSQSYTWGSVCLSVYFVLVWLFACMCVCQGVPLCMCVWECVYICVWVHVCVYICVCMCIHMYINVCVRVYIYVCVYFYVCVCACVCMVF